MAPTDRCPACGAERTGGQCPRCLIRLGLDGPGPSLAPLGTLAATLDLAPPQGTGGSVLETLAATIGSVPRLLLRDTDAGPEPPVVRPGPDPGAAGPSGRYQIQGEVARGGMGAVLKGWDPDLGRGLAIKVLLDGHRDKPELVRRFVEEAQIGGQLQHPGIVPVYELGTFGDARPYFTMKLVKGRTLAHMLAERPAPSTDLARFLGIFEQVAQTTAYAHARGVIHRDLKPSNIMVGSFGEVQVMDWGLAKVLIHGGATDDAQAGKTGLRDTVIATARSGGESDLDLSHPGSVLGTPSYMAPEQARGEVAAVDERADVFALGSILCEVLDGGPAFVGRTSGEIQRKAARGETADAFARLDACGADAELVALAKECLAPEPEDRPRDAGAVAGRVTAYLVGVQEKLRRAELEWVEERARRRLTTVAAAAAILVMATAGAGYLWVQAQRAERLARTARAVDEALAGAARLRGEARAAPAVDPAKWAKAQAAAQRADDLLTQGEADAALRGRVAAMLAQVRGEQAEAEEKGRRLEVDHALLAKLEATRLARAEHDDPKRTDAEYAAAFRAAGLDLDITEPAEAGGWLAARSDPIELAAYLDDWAYVRRTAARSEADWRRLVTAARAADPDPWREALRAKIGTKDIAALAGFRRLADDARALGAQPATGLVLLALQLKHAVKDDERAERVLRRAWDRFPGDFWVNVDLALVPGKSFGTVEDLYPRPQEAVRYLTAAAAIRPRSARARSLLGSALGVQEKLDESVAELREAVRLKPDDAKARNGLGIALQSQGKPEEAASEYREAIRLGPTLGSPHNNLAIILQEQGKLGEAVAAYREAIRLEPHNAIAHRNLGRALTAQGKREAAMAAFREAIRWEPDDLGAMVALSDAIRERDSLEKSAAALRERIRAHPDSAGDHANLGMTLDSLARYDEAIVEHREAVRLKPNLAHAQNNLAWALALNPNRRPGDLDEALKHVRRALEIERNPNKATFNTLGVVEFRAGNWEQAIAALRTGMEMQSGGNAYDWFFLAMAQWQLGRKDEARTWFDKAVAWTRDNAPDDPQLHSFWDEAASLIAR